MADTKTPAEAALAIVSAIARTVEAFEKQLGALDKAEKTQKSVHGLTATPSFKASQDGRAVPRVSRDVFKQLAAMKKSESFISTADAGDPAKRIKTVGKANDVKAGKDLPIESTEKAAQDLSKVMGMGAGPKAPASTKPKVNTNANPGNPNAKVNMGNAFNSLSAPAPGVKKAGEDPAKAPLEKVMGMGSAPAAPASVKKPLNTGANPGNPNAKVNMSNAFNSLSAPAAPVKKGTPDMNKPPAQPSNPAPSPQGAVAAPTPKAPKAPAPGAAQKAEPGVFGKIKKCGQTVAVKGVQ